MLKVNYSEQILYNFNNNKNIIIFFTFFRRFIRSNNYSLYIDFIKFFFIKNYSNINIFGDKYSIFDKRSTELSKSLIKPIDDFYLNTRNYSQMYGKSFLLRNISNFYQKNYTFDNNNLYTGIPKKTTYLYFNSFFLSFLVHFKLKRFENNNVVFHDKFFKNNKTNGFLNTKISSKYKIKKINSFFKNKTEGFIFTKFYKDTCFSKNKLKGNFGKIFLLKKKIHLKYINKLNLNFKNSNIKSFYFGFNFFTKVFNGISKYGFFVYNDDKYWLEFEKMVFYKNDFFELNGKLDIGYDVYKNYLEKNQIKVVNYGYNAYLDKINLYSLNYFFENTKKFEYNSSLSLIYNQNSLIGKYDFKKEYGFLNYDSSDSDLLDYDFMYTDFLSTNDDYYSIYRSRINYNKNYVNIESTLFRINNIPKLYKKINYNANTLLNSFNLSKSNIFMKKLTRFTKITGLESIKNFLFNFRRYFSLKLHNSLLKSYKKFYKKKYLGSSFNYIKFTNNRLNKQKLFYSTFIKKRIMRNNFYLLDNKYRKVISFFKKKYFTTFKTDYNSGDIFCSMRLNLIKKKKNNKKKVIILNTIYGYWKKFNFKNESLFKDFIKNNNIFRKITNYFGVYLRLFSENNKKNNKKFVKVLGKLFLYYKKVSENKNTIFYKNIFQYNYDYRDKNYRKKSFIFSKKNVDYIDYFSEFYNNKFTVNGLKNVSKLTIKNIKLKLTFEKSYSDYNYKLDLLVDDFLAIKEKYTYWFSFFSSWSWSFIFLNDFSVVDSKVDYHKLRSNLSFLRQPFYHLKDYFFNHEDNFKQYRISGLAYSESWKGNLSLKNFYSDLEDVGSNRFDSNSYDWNYWFNEYRGFRFAKTRKCLFKNYYSKTLRFERNKVRHFFDMKHRYQFTLTTWLFRFKKYYGLTVFSNISCNLVNSFMSSNLINGSDNVKYLINKNFCFLNGYCVRNGLLPVFSGDVLSLWVSWSMYVYLIFINKLHSYNNFFLKYFLAEEVKKLNKKTQNRKYWYYFFQSRLHTDMPYYLETDYLTLTCVVLCEPSYMYLLKKNYYKLTYAPLLTLFNLNWKYIV